MMTTKTIAKTAMIIAKFSISYLFDN